MTQEDTFSLRRAVRLGPVVWLATGAWVGFIPWAPGTFGSLLGIPLAWAIGTLWEPWLQGAVLGALALAGVPICDAAVRRLGGPHDPGCIVIDEVVGMAATLFLFDSTRPLTLMLGFLLFRLFDITKPSPARELDRLPHGWGVMSDDLAAALYANLSLRFILWIGDTLLPSIPPAG